MVIRKAKIRKVSKEEYFRRQEEFLDAEYPYTFPFSMWEQPCISPYAEDLWILNKDYRLRFIYKGELYEFLFYKGTIWDLASVPTMGLRITGGAHCPEFVLMTLVHDLVYRLELLPRKLGDELMRHISQYHVTSGPRRGVMYGAVRIGGGVPWRKHRRREKRNDKRFNRKK